MTDSPSPTEKLYLDDPYTVSFTANLVSCERQDDGSYAAVLDGTFFYPESGGQLPDTGRIGDVDVTSVWEDDAGIVYHSVTSQVGEGDVTCKVDWKRRQEHMHHHTGQHILSRAFIEVGSLHTISFHMGDEVCTIDVEGPKISDAIIEEVENLANAVVQENRPVIIKNVAREKLDDDALRKKLPTDVDVARLVEVEGFDVIGCCGTHVRRTGELALIKVLKTEKAKGAHRVYFKVGRRALEDFQHKHKIVKKLSKYFTTGVDGIEDKVEKLQSDTRTLRKEMKALSSSLAIYEANAMAESARVAGERRFVVGVLTRDDEFIKLLASELRKKDNTVSLLGGPSGRITCVASPDTEIDLCEVAVKCAESVGGSGGGKGGFATLQLPPDADVEQTLEKIYEVLKKLQVKGER